MGDRSEPFEPYEPSPEYEWGDEPGRGEQPRILWGRVAALVVFGLVALLIGRWTAPSGSEEDLAGLRRQLAAARAEIDDLEQQLVDAQATETPPADEPPPGDGGTGGEEEMTYTVKRGDTFRGIAEQFYGDATLDDFIMEANGIDDPTSLRVGQELIIPTEPE